MKRCLVLMLSLVMVFNLSSFVYAEPSVSNDEIKVILKNYTDKNGDLVREHKVEFDVEPQIINGRTMVPIRAVAEELGFSVSWDGRNVLLSSNFLTRDNKSGIEEHFSAFEHNAIPSDYLGFNQADCLLNLFEKLSTDLVLNKNTGDVHIGSLNNWGFLYSSHPMTENGKIKRYNGGTYGTVTTLIKIDTTMDGPHPYLELHFQDLESFKTTSNKKIFSEYVVASFETYTYGMDVGATIINGRTLLPLRAITESMGAKVDWNGETRTVIIDFLVNN